MSEPLQRSRRVWFGPLAVLVVFYWLLQWLYISRLPLVMDEFQGAWTVYRLVEEVPYRDFAPYKTILGYYLQLPVLLSGDGPWVPLLRVKLAMATLTAAGWLLAGWVLMKTFRPRAVVAGTALLVAMSTFLERSSALRVDMLTSLAGLAALVFLLRRRWGIAGLAAAVSFLVSQKGVYFVLAANVGLILEMLIVTGWKKDSWRRWLAFNGAALAVLVGYLAFWASLSSVDAVVTTVFFSHGQIALENLYDIQLQYWAQTLRRNPLFYTLAAMSLGWLALRVGRARSDGQRSTDALLVGWASAMIGLCLWHKQPWPYFFVLLIPTLSVLHMAFFDALAEVPRPRFRTLAVFLGLVAGAGVVLPLALRVPANLARDNTLQRLTVTTLDAVLEPGDTYLAGVDLLFARDQPSAELQWLDLRRSRALGRLSGEERMDILRRLDQQPVRCLVSSYRLRNLPRPLPEYLESRFRHWWGNLYLYSRLLPAGEGSIDLSFTGLYRVEGPPGILVRAGERSLVAGEVIQLSEGPWRYRSDQAFRLSLEPPADLIPDPRFPQPQAFFPRVYEY